VFITPVYLADSTNSAAWQLWFNLATGTIQAIQVSDVPTVPGITLADSVTGLFYYLTIIGNPPPSGLSWGDIQTNQVTVPIGNPVNQIVVNDTLGGVHAVEIILGMLNSGTARNVLTPYPPVPQVSPTSTPAVFIYRQLNPYNDPQWGQGVANFLTNVYAVAQAVRTILLLFLGEWWESVLDGTPMWQKILGVGPSGGQSLTQQVSLIIQQRILGSPYVTGISNLVVSFNLPQRAFSISCDLQTSFGSTSVSIVPQPSAQGLPS
jgi:hypothetical protein